MFKKLILAVLVALPMTAFAQKLAVVDVEGVFAEMPETKEMQTKIEDASKQYETAMQGLADELNKLYQDYQAIANDATVLDTIKERRIQEIQERQQNAERFRTTAQQDLARQQQQLAAPIFEKLNQAISSVGKEGNYSLVLPKNPELTLYVGSDVTDITAMVKAKLGIK
ncbi:MAG: OmpH family outer membrane protein [Muribaculaceae bacterium]|nr:OmpH family outer membrane protein [Muribaculaceae bacterium]